MSTSDESSPAVTLMERGSLDTRPDATPPAAVCRGMSVHSDDGRMVGRVAAVVLALEQQTVTHLLLRREGPCTEYRLIPAELVAAVDAGQIRLRIPAAGLESLALWHGNATSA